LKRTQSEAALSAGEIVYLRLSLTNLGCQLAGTALQGTTLLCLREMQDLQSTITQVIALGE